MKKLLSIILVTAMLFGICFTMPVSAAAPETVSKWDGTIPTTHTNFKTQDGTTTDAGKESNPYVIESAADLANLAAAISGGAATWGMYFSLTCDLDMNGQNYSWVGIGNNTGADKRFEGIFLGNNHVVYNLKMANNTENCGFFNLTHCASIYDLGIVSADIDVTYSTGAFSVGALVGRAMGGTTISNCFVADADITVDGGSQVAKTGLLVGNINCTTTHGSKDFYVKNCFVKGSISAQSASKLVNIGGLIGTQSHQVLKVENTTVVCDIIRTNGNKDDKFAAFLSDTAKNSTYTNCNATLTVTTDVAPTVIPGAIGKAWAGTITATNSARKISLTVGAEAAQVNPTPSQPDNFTATTENIDITFSALTANLSGQNHAAGNKVRFNAELMFSVGAFSKTGYVVAFDGNSGELSGTVVYTSLMAIENGVSTPTTPTAGKYFISYGLSDIPATASGDVTVTPFVELADGTRVFGTSGTCTLANGAITFPTTNN